MIMTNHINSNHFLIDFQFEFKNELKFLVVKINQEFITSIQKQQYFFITDGSRESKLTVIPNLIEVLVTDWLNYSGN